MHESPLPGILNGLVYAVGGLLVFFAVVSVTRKILPIESQSQAIVAAAVIIGAAIIISETLH